MDLLTGLLSYVVIWAVVFLVTVPIRLQTQDESGEVTPGTHGGSPHRHGLKKKARITTVVSLAIWAVMVWIVMTGHVTLSDIDLFSRFGPGSIQEHGPGE